MAANGDFYTTVDAARRLGLTVRRVQQMLDAGDFTRMARGLVDAASVDRYAATGTGGRTRVWAENTAWGAVALLSGLQPTWLGSAQASRLRTALRSETNAVDLVARVRDRAVVRTFAGHSAARDRLTRTVISTDVAALGLVDAGSTTDDTDGYIAAGELEETVRRLGLVDDPNGKITLRATSFDIRIVRDLARSTTAVLAAIDAVTSLDPRERGVGERVLSEALARYRH